MNRRTAYIASLQAACIVGCGSSKLIVGLAGKALRPSPYLNGRCQGMNFRAALVAEGYCQEVGFESPAAGKFCRTKGVTLNEIKRFSTWLAQHDDDVVLSTSARTREQERINKVTALSEEQKQQNRELQRLALIGTGILTSAPLVAYTYATNYLALNLLGFCQYISPILTLVLGIFVYQESFGWEKIYPMLFVWLGIVLFIFGQRKIRRFRLSR